jgi:hypothetical protein
MDKLVERYPDRKTYFAHRYCRLLTKTCAAQEIGHIAFVLCVTIAHQEDSKRYTGPVTFFNEQLMPLIGVAKWESLDGARRRATQAGWLYYEPGNRGQRLPGRYWVTIPQGLDDVADANCDESHYPANGQRVESQSPNQYPQNGEREGEHSNLTLNLSNSASDDTSASAKKIKSKRTSKQFTAPTLEEVQDYCKERKNQVNPQQFIDHYEARGWKFKGGQPMKDWHASVRTWEVNAFQSSTPSKPQEPIRYRA